MASLASQAILPLLVAAVGYLIQDFLKHRSAIRLEQEKHRMSLEAAAQQHDRTLDAARLGREATARAEADERRHASVLERRELLGEFVRLQHEFKNVCLSTIGPHTDERLSELKLDVEGRAAALNKRRFMLGLVCSPGVVEAVRKVGKCLERHVEYASAALADTKDQDAQDLAAESFDAYWAAVTALEKAARAELGPEAGGSWVIDAEEPVPFATPVLSVVDAADVVAAA